MNLPTTLTGNPYIDALLISFLPIGILTVYIVTTGQLNRKTFSFYIFLIALTQFYIVAIDPTTSAALFTAQGNYWYPLLLAGVSGGLLVIAYQFGQETNEEIV